MGNTVSELILGGFSYSARIGFTAGFIAIILGVTLGSAAALQRGKFWDKLIQVVTTALVSMPSFVMATLLLLLFALQLSWLPSLGNQPGGLILPVVSLSLYPMAYITKLQRSAMLDVLGQDYIRTARAKGVNERAVIFKHALKNALIPVITYVGPMTAYILTGSMVVESVFTTGGLGTKFVQGITNRDYPMIMGTTIFLATLMVTMTLISDLVYKIVDPRISFD